MLALKAADANLPPEICLAIARKLEYLENVGRCFVCGEWTAEWPPCAEGRDPCRGKCASCLSPACNFCERGPFCLCAKTRRCAHPHCGYRMCEECALAGFCVGCAESYCPTHSHARFADE